MRWLVRALCILSSCLGVNTATAGTTIIFVNGINNTPQMAADNTNILLRRYCDAYSCQDTTFTLYYNNTDTFFDDVGELNVQAETEKRADALARLYARKTLGLSESMELDLTHGSQGYILHRQAKDAYVALLSFDDTTNKLVVPQDFNTFGLDAKNANQAIGKSLRELRAKVIEELNKDAGTRKVVLVPHSQGNYFAQTVAASVRAVEASSISRRLAVLGVASVSSMAIERNEHVSLRQDRALFLHATGTSYYLNGNFDAGWSIGSDPSKDDFLQSTENSSNNHGFIETYFNARFLPLPISLTKCGLVPVPKEEDPRQLWDTRKLAYGITCSYRPDFSTMPTLMGVGSNFPSQRGISLHSFIAQRINSSIIAMNSGDPTLSLYANFKFENNLSDSVAPRPALSLVGVQSPTFTTRGSSGAISLPSGQYLANSSGMLTPAMTADGNHSFSVATHVKFDAWAPQTNAIVYERAHNGTDPCIGPTYGISNYNNGGRKWLMLISTRNDQGGCVNEELWSTVDASLGQWYHVAGTYDQTTGRARLYVNGAVVAEKVIAKRLSLASNPFLSIGQQPWGGDQFIRGALDDLRFYRGPLSATEIAALAGTNNASNTSGTLTVLANAIPGASLTVPNGSESCTFKSTGSWSAGPQAPPQYQNADGVIGGTSYNLTEFGVPMPSAPNMALVVKHSSTGTWDLLGSSKTITVVAGESLSFMMNDATTFGYTDGNTGQLTTAWSCQ